MGSRHDHLRLASGKAGHAPSWIWFGLLGISLGLLGCVTPRQSLGTLSQDLERRSGHALGDTNTAAGRLPPGVSLEDGLTEDEAVTIALSNNAAFRELLTDLGLAQADLVQAGMFPNPRFAMLVPVGVKPLELTATYPLEVLWLRPRRVRAAALDLDRVSGRLLQAGLDVIRDVRLAVAEIGLARERIAVAREALQISHQISDLVSARFRAGDASELEASTSLLEARQLEEQKNRLERDSEIAVNRLRSLLGLGLEPWPAVRMVIPRLPRFEGEPSVLVSNALASRPDLRAAQLGVEAAGQRIGLAQAEIFTIAAGINVKNVDLNRVTGPALELAVPIFNQNQGGRAIARARFEQAARQFTTVRERIVLEVREAHLRMIQAQESLDQWDHEILPGLQANVEKSERAFAAGNVSYLFVLESSRRLTDARAREAAARTDHRRAWAELERSIGQRLPTADGINNPAQQP